MKQTRPALKTWLITAFGLAASLNLGSAKAACEPTFDPFMSAQMGMPVSPVMGHPCAQPHPGASIQTVSPDGGTTFVKTPEGHFPAQDPFAAPPGSNFLLTVYEDMKDMSGRDMPNTLPSTQDTPYNLHDGPVLTRRIDPASPEDDLDRIIDRVEKAAREGRRHIPVALARLGIDILEGNPVQGRAYSGFPMLHYNGPNKVKKVEPVCAKKNGRTGKCRAGETVVGGNVDVNMIYFNQHLESDTAFIDPSAVQEVPWTVTYHVNILHRGMEDFSPNVMHFNRIVNPANGQDMLGPFHASMDQTYFPMLDEGTRYTIKLKQTHGKYFNLAYIWGWRIHPPRVQVIENALKTAGPDGWTLPQWEKSAFCEGGVSDPDCDPVRNRHDRAYAIGQIGDLSPAKRMWTLFKRLQDDHGSAGNLSQVAADLRRSYLDWTDRTQLPTGVSADPNATLTLFYVNNTLYGSKQGTSGEGTGMGAGSFKGIANGSAHDWNLRPYLFKVTLLNGDRFPHAYMNVDFGGSRGWENHFQNTDPTTLIGAHPEIPPGHPGEEAPFNDPANTVAGHDQMFPINRGGIEEFLQPTPRNPDDPDNGAPQLGSGCFFTFGRNHAWPNAGGPWGAIMTPPVAADGTPGMHKVEIEYNFEPSSRLKIYQFDPLHHDVAVYSLH